MKMKKLLYLFPFLIFCNIVLAYGESIHIYDYPSEVLTKHRFSVSVTATNLIPSNDIYYMACVDLVKESIISSQCSEFHSGVHSFSYTANFHITENGTYKIKTRLIKKVGDKQTLIATDEKSFTAKGLGEYDEKISGIEDYIKTNEKSWLRDTRIGIFTFIRWVKEKAYEIYQAIYEFLVRDFVLKSDYEVLKEGVEKLERRVSVLEKVIEKVNDEELHRACLETMIENNLTEFECGKRTYIHWKENNIVWIEPIEID